VLRRFGLGLLVLLVVALLVLNVLAFSGALVDDETATPTVPAEPAPPPAESDLARPPDRGRDEQIARRRSRARSVGPTLMLSATRGDCWVEVRADSATGPALYAGTLTTGRSLRFNRPKLWLRLGAASNVDIVVNGRPSSIPPGTVELTVPDA
jgi:Domain of unknown function (DUF4115)